MQSINDVFEYDPETGYIYWKIFIIKAKIFPGKMAGTVKKDGYVRVTYSGKHYKGHSLAWYLHYGEWPTHDIDHKNRDRSDNSISNLVPSNKELNQWNRSDQSKYGPGIYRRNGRYTVKYKGIDVGRFDTLDMAIYVRQMAIQSSRIE